MNTHIDIDTIKQVIKDHYDDRALFEYHVDEDFKQQLEQATHKDLRIDWLAIDLLVALDRLTWTQDLGWRKGDELATEQDKYDLFCDMETWCENNNLFDQIKTALMQSQDRSSYVALVDTFEIGNTINI
jgi:hypothetical protein